MNSRLVELRRYILASAFSFLLVVGLTAFFHEVAGISESVAPIPALTLAFLANFTLLRRYVFPRQAAAVGRQMAETAIASIAFRGIEYGLFLGMHLSLEINYLIATALSLCISAVAKFFVYRELVFNRSRRR